MTQEEKAKAYDELKVKASRIYHKENDVLIMHTIEDLFPELKESEDEKIRKEILSFCQNRADNYPNDPKYANIGNWIAWLEKQGEQKPTDKVEPKFKVGDWIIYDRHISKVKDMDSEGYLVEDTYGNEGVPTKEFTEKHYRLWTIKDAKDGDVLFMDNGASNCIFIYKSFDNGIINKYASYNKFGFEGEHYLVLNDGYVIPATNEQRDLLFQKMKEAEYEWDAEKKELKKIERNPWSEEDKVKDNWEFVHEFVEKFGRIPKDEDELNKDFKNYMKGE